MRRVGPVAFVLLIASVSCEKDVDPTGPAVTPRDTTSIPAPPSPSPAAGTPSGVLAFVSRRSGNPDIYTANADGSNLKQLTNDPATDDYPAWSPDGKRIAFVSSRAGAGLSDIYTMDADGSNVVRRTHDGNSFDPAWSPDGRRIAFASKRGDRRLIYIAAVEDDWSTARRIGFPTDEFESEPAWSPDGKLVAFSSAGGDYTAGLFIASVDGSGIRPLLNAGQGPSHYSVLNATAWSPDGSRLAVVACDPFPCLQKTTIRVMRVDGSGYSNLKDVMFPPRLAWSSDGVWLAYAEPCSGGTSYCLGSIMAMKADGSGLAALISDAYDPAWRPEPTVLTPGPVKVAPASVIASNPAASGKSFVSAAMDTYRGAAFVTIRNRTANAGSVAASLAAGGFDPVAIPAQAGDEILLSVLSQGGDSLDLTMVKVPPRRPPSVVRTSPSKGRTDVALTVQIEVVFTEPVNPSSVNASTFGVFRGVAQVPGKIIVAGDGLSATFIPDDALERSTSYSVVATTGIRDLDGDALQELTTSTFTTANPPTGTIAFVSERDGNAEIYTINIDGTDLRRLTNDAGKDVDPAWSPDGRFIAFSSDRDGSMKLYQMNADGSNVMRKTSTLGEHPSWSKDGKKIAFTGTDVEFCCSIRIADASGDWSQSALVTPGFNTYSTHPSWSADGRQIVFASDGVWDGQQIYSMNSDGTGIRVLLQATADFSRYDVGEVYAEPAWSPDGTRIAVVACHFAPHNCHPYSTISIMNSDGSGLHVLRFAGGEARPAWSGDSQIIAFSSASCGVCRKTIRYAYVDGRAIENDVIIEDGYSPAWKP